jgi:hypothetical protein
MKSALALALLAGLGGAAIQALIANERTREPMCRTAHIVVHTYDGPVGQEFCFDDFQYTGADLYLIGHESGDGIFHGDFETGE